MKYYIIAGEASGDLHGAGLIRALLQCDDSARIRFWGGGKMAAEGGEMVHDYRDGAVMGFSEVIRKAGTLRRNLSFCKSDIAAWKPDAVILIDYPGFNLRIARYASRLGIKVFYYIAPKVWATREGRIRKIRRAVDKLFVIFPFEQEYFRQRGVDALYVGNPLSDELAAVRDGDDDYLSFCKLNGLPESKYVALLPGSRRMELEYTMPVFARLERQMESAGLGDYKLVLAAAPSIDDSVYDGYLAGSSIKVVRGRTAQVLRHASAAVIDSGTASLEAALLGVPQVVVYGMNPLSFLLARLMLKTEYVSLANIIMDKPVFSELLQKDFNEKAVLDELRLLLFDENRRSRMLADYGALRDRMGASGAALCTARQMVSLLGGSPSPKEEMQVEE